MGRMAALDDILGRIAEDLLDPGEELLGACVGNRQGAFTAGTVAILVTPGRLVIQPLSRRLEAKGEPISLPPERIAKASADGGGGGWVSINAAIMDSASVALKLRTTDGAKMKLMMMRGEGLLGNLGGGEVQRLGVEALGAWFARHAGG